MRTAWIVRTIGLLSSALLALALYAALWGGYAPDPKEADTAMWDVFYVSMFLFGYVFIQAAAAHSPPTRINIWWALDIVFSVLPLFTAGAAAVAYVKFGMVFTTFQVIVVILVTAATLIDLALIYVFFRDQPKYPVSDGAMQAGRRWR